MLVCLILVRYAAANDTGDADGLRACGAIVFTRGMGYILTSLKGAMTGAF